MDETGLHMDGGWCSVSLSVHCADDSLEPKLGLIGRSRLGERVHLNARNWEVTQTTKEAERQVAYQSISPRTCSLLISLTVSPAHIPASADTGVSWITRTHLI